MRTDTNRGDPMNDLDLVADLNAQDDDGLGWSTLADTHAPERVRPGAMLLAGNSQAQAVVRSWPSTTTVRSTSRSCPARSPKTGICSTERWPEGFYSFSYGATPYGTTRTGTVR